MPIEQLGQRWIDAQPISFGQWTAAITFMVFGAISIGVSTWWDKMKVTPPGRLTASLDVIAHDARTWLAAATIVMFGIPITIWLVSPAIAPQPHAGIKDIPSALNPTISSVTENLIKKPFIEWDGVPARLFSMRNTIALEVI